MRNYEKKLELACHWMEQLDVLQPCIDALRKGELWQSEGAGIMSGLLYTAEPAIREQAKKLEEKYDALVWHAINGINFSVVYHDKENLTYLHLLPLVMARGEKEISAMAEKVKMSIKHCKEHFQGKTYFQLLFSYPDALREQRITNLSGCFLSKRRKG